LIGKYVSIFEAIAVVQDAAASGRIGPSQWYQLSLLPADRQGELLEMHLAGVPRDQLAAACRAERARAAPSPAGPKLSRVRLPLSTGTMVTVSGPAMTLPDLILALSAARDAALKANKDSLDIKTAERVWKDHARKPPAGGAGHG
jgi:hypothetical protein